jgi:hypothetical protein
MPCSGLTLMSASWFTWPLDIVVTSANLPVESNLSSTYVLAYILKKCDSIRCLDSQSYIFDPDIERDDITSAQKRRSD